MTTTKTLKEDLGMLLEKHPDMFRNPKVAWLLYMSECKGIKFEPEVERAIMTSASMGSIDRALRKFVNDEV